MASSQQNMQTATAADIDKIRALVKVSAGKRRGEMLGSEVSWLTSARLCRLCLLVLVCRTRSSAC